MRVKPTDNKLYFTAGTASTRKNGEKIPVEFIYYNDPSCGYYLDPRGFLVLPNFNSVSGDKDEKLALYIVDGSIEIDTVENVIQTVNNFCKNTAVSATGVIISGCLGTTLASTATRQLTSLVQPTGAVQTGTWTSNNTEVLAVSSTGLVTAGDPGTATITFTSTDGGFTASCTITVV